MALEMAGNNRKELEKVIKHYSTEKSDSLKLKAAIFLIENMPGHYSYSGKEITKYYEEVNHILATDCDIFYKRDQIEAVAKKYPAIQQSIVQDIQIITGDYLIHTIEKAFYAWQSKPWAQHVDFDTFCEYILPYKCRELQPLDYWRDTLENKFIKQLTSEPYNDQSYRSAFITAQTINKEINQEIKPILKDSYTYDILSASTIYKIPTGTCDDYTALAVSVKRSQGLPVIIESVPNWGYKDTGHTWHTLIHNNGAHLPFRWGIESEPGDAFFPHHAVPKVLRYMYKSNKERQKFYQEAAMIPPFMGGIFCRDVTDQYIKTKDLIIPVTVDNIIDKYAFITVFDNRTWVSIDYGIIQKRKAYFKKMGCGIVYLIMGYDGDNLIPISNPFILTETGEIKYLEPDFNNTVDSVHLIRKYFSTKLNVVTFESRILGGKIQASNDKNFNDFVTLYTIDSLRFPDLIKPNNRIKYRYWRFHSAENTYCNLAELQFYEKGTDTIASGTIIGGQTLFENDPKWLPEHVFDGNWLTCYHSNEFPRGSSIGLDLGEPKLIDRIRVVSRSDDNGIHYGDEYELYYWDEGMWQTLGRQSAQDKVLFYSNIPGNSLLLLKNHTRGKQERIFTYENGLQRFY